jgi:hypothetical protein
MKERPILFSGPMVRALLDGSKTQTRRVMNAKPSDECPEEMWPHALKDIVEWREQNGRWFGLMGWRSLAFSDCPYGMPGDRLWVRETFLYVGPGSGSDLPSYREERANPENHKATNCWFRASQPDETLVWTPSIHMPRWASRITLEVTGVRVERLQDISEADAWSEGCPTDATWPLDWYRDLWNNLAAPGADWDANPWVWVVEFKRVSA